MQLLKFSESHTEEYKAIDKAIGDILHQHYLKKLYDADVEYDRRIEMLAADIFKTIEPNLQGSLTPSEAKNYKKLLSAI